MKKLFTLYVLLLPLVLFGFGEKDTIFAESKISKVTVFLNGAQITRSAKAHLNAGKHLLVFNKLPEGLDPSTVQVRAGNGMTILAVKTGEQISGGKNPDKALEESLEKQLKEIKIETTRLKTQISVLDVEEAVLMDNHVFTAQSGTSQISQIKEAADYYKTRMTEIKNQRLDIILHLNELEEKVGEIDKKLTGIYYERAKRYTGITVLVENSKSVDSEITFWYYHTAAGWEPVYDFRVENVDKPLSIVYNANIFQTTGENWDNVLITLSNSNPLSGGDKPIFTPWYVNRGNSISSSSVYKRETVYTSGQGGAIKGKIIDAKTNEPIAFANVVVESNGKQVGGAATDFDGNYTIKPVLSGRYDMKSTYVGYKPVLAKDIWVRDNEITFLDVRMEQNTVALTEFVITEYQVPLIKKDNTMSGEVINMTNGGFGASSAGYDANDIRGTRSDGTVTYIDGVKVRGSASLPQSSTTSKGIITDNFNSNQLKTTAVGIEYAIEIPYSIPCDGEDHTIKMRETQVDVNYVYYLAPKLDPEAFLTAELTDWSALNLLSGKVSLYFQGTFVGNSAIDMNYPDDTLKLSLGRDKSIICKRELNKEVFDKKIIGSSVREVIGYTITVRNTRNADVHIVLEDQFPLSELKSYYVELLDNGNATVDHTKGLLKWDITLKPEERKQLMFKYSVKYPK